MDGPPTYSQFHALRPLHALPPHLLADGDDDEEGEEVRRAELRDAVKGYAAFVGALAGSLRWSLGAGRGDTARHGAARDAGRAGGMEPRARAGKGDEHDHQH